MWVLLLVIKGVLELNGPLTVSVIKIADFYTEASCEHERVRITMDMMKSYPGETNYYLECKSVVRRGV